MRRPRDGRVTRSPLLPDSAIVESGRLSLGGVDAERLVHDHGSPLFVYDAPTLRARARAYVEPLATVGGRAAFACKALPVPGVLRRLRAAGMIVDVASAGEIEAARRAGFPGPDLVVHGNAKTKADLDAAVDAGAGLVVLDAPEEVPLAARVCRAAGRRQDVLLRITPDIAVDTHEKIATGHAGSKFGFRPDQAVGVARALPPELAFRGLHVHLGSQIVDDAPLVAVARYVARLTRDSGLACEILDLGGGLGVSYRSDTPGPDAGAFARSLVADAGEQFRAAGLPVPQLIVEPGRSVVAQAGVTLYRVSVVKRTATGAAWVAVDGGFGDNLRAALYDAPYEPFLAARAGEPASGQFDVAGHHCESGDVIARDVPLADPRPGDVVAVPMTGAYHQSLSSTYNLYGRPAAVVVGDGDATLVTRRETIDDLLAREL